MKCSLRCPLVSAVALATYLVVHVFAGVVHHHVAENRPQRLPTAYDTELQFQTTRSADNDEEEETCLLCSVLHLAQVLPPSLHVEAVAALNGEGLSATAIIRPHPLQTATYSRGPPSI